MTLCTLYEASNGGNVFLYPPEKYDQEITFYILKPFLQFEKILSQWVNKSYKTKLLTKFHILNFSDSK